MPIYKRCIRCGKRIESGTTCECLKERYKEYDRTSRDRESKTFYDGKAWRMTRDNIIGTDEIDIYLYMTMGQMVAADTVHHIIPLKDDRTLSLNADNLMSLHHDTHSMIEQRYKKDKKGMIAELTAMLQAFRKGEGVSEKFLKRPPDPMPRFPRGKF